MSKPAYWEQAKQHLSDACPVMRQLIIQYGAGSLERRTGDGFSVLTRAIVGQQISVKAADAVWNKLQQKVKPFTAERVMRTRISTLRGCGLSESKANYVKNIAAFFIDHPYQAPDDWAQHDDETAIEMLVDIKGVGRWTAEMFLMFYLLRPDIFPVQDLGVLKAIHAYVPNIPEKTGNKYHAPKLYIETAEIWKPYRTVASWYLWRALDPIPVAY